MGREGGSGTGNKGKEGMAELNLGSLSLNISLKSVSIHARGNGQKKEDLPVSNDGYLRGDQSSADTESRISNLKSQEDSPGFKGRPAEFDRSHAIQVLESPLFHQLPMPLQRESILWFYLWDYLCALPVEEIGIPDYLPELGRELKNLRHRNLIYPLGPGVFAHVRQDTKDIRDGYMVIDPPTNPSIKELMQRIDRRLIDCVQILKQANGKEERIDILTQQLDRICTTNSDLRHRTKIKVTERELAALRYLMARDKEGLGVIEPLLKDPYLEDISCDGVGSVFLEHKIFGGLKSSISFSNSEELDHFVVRLSEKIGRPVTVREPIIDSVLPDGSRINIVYGGDVSKKGSNFTIRKFSAIPLSILDLIEEETLSYTMAAYLSLVLGEGMNSFVVGETASGKTTLLNAITTFINPMHKIVSIEDTPEIQVAHPHWTREVVRGGIDDTRSISMHDLLLAALRQRPNLIIIGEMRGPEGSIAFQAMQTGHSCMATFHAGSVENLVQRLTGNPINIPNTHIGILNIVIVVGFTRKADGSPVRKILSINEIIGYDPDLQAVDYVEIFRWNPEENKFDFPGYMNSRILQDVVSVRRGLSSRDDRFIYEELENRATVLSRLHERGLTNFYELHQVLSQAHREGLFR